MASGHTLYQARSLWNDVLKKDEQGTMNDFHNQDYSLTALDISSLIYSKSTSSYPGPNSTLFLLAMRRCPEVLQFPTTVADLPRDGCSKVAGSTGRGSAAIWGFP